MAVVDTMSLLTEIHSVSSDLVTPDLLRYLIKERFPKKTIVTASLRGRSIAVLSMIAEIEPSTPVVFCRPGYLFPKSLEYRQTVVELLGLTNVVESQGHETSIEEGDCDHCEPMWSENEDTSGRTFELVHLNKTLAPYDCWISAVYHRESRPNVRHRVDIEGRLIRVDPLLSWSNDEIRNYLSARDIPMHPRARRRVKHRSKPRLKTPTETYHF